MWIEYKGYHYQVKRNLLIEACQRYVEGDTNATITASWKGFYSHGKLEIPVAKLKFGNLIKAREE